MDQATSIYQQIRDSVAALLTRQITPEQHAKTRRAAWERACALGLAPEVYALLQADTHATLAAVAVRAAQLREVRP